MERDIDRLEVRITTAFKDELERLAIEANVPMYEMLVRLACKAIKWSPERAIPPRLPPGRKRKRND